MFVLNMHFFVVSFSISISGFAFGEIHQIILIISIIMNFLFIFFIYLYHYWINNDCWVFFIVLDLLVSVLFRHLTESSDHRMCKWTTDVHEDCYPDEGQFFRSVSLPFVKNRRVNKCFLIFCSHFFSALLLWFCTSKRF